MVLADGNVVLVSTMDHHVVVRMCKHVALPCLLADSLVGVRSDSEATQPGHQPSWQTSSAPLGPSVRLIGSPPFWRGGAAAELRFRVCCSIAFDSHVLNYFAASLPENR